MSSYLKPLQPITSTMPMLISIDFLQLERPSGVCECIMVIFGNFIRFAQSYPTKKHCKTAAERLFNNLFLSFGFAETILSDQGRKCEKKVAPLSGKTLRCSTIMNDTTPSTVQWANWEVQQDLTVDDEKLCKEGKIMLERLRESDDACLQLYT